VTSGANDRSDWTGGFGTEPLVELGDAFAQSFRNRAPVRESSRLYRFALRV
jgi:hypothetical protein